MKKALFLLFISFNLGFSQDTDTHLGRVNEALTQSLVGGKKIRFNDLGGNHALWLQQASFD